MKYILKIFAVAALLVLAFNSCKKDEKLFCIDNIANSGTLALGEVTITVPGEQTYTGLGALPGPLKIGKYEGKISSVIIKQTPTVSGMNVELRHFFDDGKGNTFWTHDYAEMTLVSASKYEVHDEMMIWMGTGDFECATGLLINEGVAYFAKSPLDHSTKALAPAVDRGVITLPSSKIDYSITGTICGGCN